MNDPMIYDRFEELEAGRLLGDLSEEEWQEWRELSELHSLGPVGSLEAVTAAVEAEFLMEKAPPLPADLAERLHVDAESFVVPPADAEKIVQGSFNGGPLSSARFAWAIAAVLAVLLVAKTLTDPSNPPVNPLAGTLPLEERATDLLVTEFSGLESYDGMSGKVVWSDALQEGYMALTGLPSNDPSTKQYQLWIVDPTRDKAPVDGGVFDIPAGATPAIIPIRNPVPVTNPVAFLITLEKPGGVVVSDQEVKVALAQPS